MRGAFRNRNFRLLWFGQSTSLLGDQFYMIALPWLVLQMTGDPLALGTILALAGIPRALFILVGGAVTDRLSPRAVMLASDALRLLLSVLLTVMVLAGWLQVWLLYVLALAFGLVSGFFMPASGAILPGIVTREELQGANAVINGTAQLSSFAGPLLAGGLIALFSRGSGAVSSLGIALAFAADALSFLVSVVTLWLMQAPGRKAGVAPTADPAPGIMQTGRAVWHSILAGLRYALGNPTFKLLFFLISTMNFLLSGPFAVGVPVLARSRLPEGAAAFGVIMSAMGAGNLLGYIAAGGVRLQHVGRIVPLAFAVFGLGMISFSFLTSTAAAFAVVLLMGFGNGFIALSLITWLQKNTQLEMMGRMTALVMFSSVGLAPISQALAGGLIKLSIPALFGGAGVLVLATALVAARTPEMRAIESQAG